MVNLILFVQLVTFAFFLRKGIAGESLGNDVILAVIIGNIVASATIYVIKSPPKRTKFAISLAIGLLVTMLHVSGSVCQGKNKRGCVPIGGISYFPDSAKQSG